MGDKKSFSGISWIKAILFLQIISSIYLVFYKLFFEKFLFLDFFTQGNLFGDIANVFSNELFYIILTLFSVIITSLVLFGVYKRIKWTYYLAFISFIIGILVSFGSIIWNLVSLKFTVLIPYIFNIATNSLFIWYFIKRKEYFLDKSYNLNFSNPDIQKQEKIFKRLIIIFIVLYFVLLIVVSVFITATQLSSSLTLVNEINKRDPSSALKFCEAKTNLKEKDICLFTFVQLDIKKYQLTGVENICLQISDLNIRDNCYLLALKCSDIKNADLKAGCIKVSKI